MNGEPNNRRRHRCAIYTRKSHEEGLDQEFNSLDAQREACEAYILSQAGLGWELINKQYDDGGISGGHMEREGLQELLNDIRAGHVDVVVVYKVDRLTRSITDFGKLVEAFDEQEVSFVSVTQAFNTTNSMGRLTLNVLLSFAQFEREVTAERIRDKIASSKQKGMWMGGRVPFGYRNENRQLFIEPEEAKTLRLMFDLYLTLRNVRLVREELDRRNIFSRKYTNKSGDSAGGIPFTRGNIASILSNPVYRGKIKHKDKVYPGNHEAIISKEKWDEVQALLSARSTNRSSRRNVSSPALFNGLLFDEHGNRLVATHTRKNGMKYHYYVAQPVADADPKLANLRMPMEKLDRTIHQIIEETLSDLAELVNALKLQNETAQQLITLTQTAQLLIENLQSASPDEQKNLYCEITSKIIICSDCITIDLNPEGLREHLRVKLPEGLNPKIEKQMIVRRRGQEMKLVVGGLENKQQNADPSLIGLIAKAHHLKTKLQDGSVCSIKEYAEVNSIDHGDAKNLIPLAYLAPSIIEDILAGYQPAELTAVRMKELARHLPDLWSEQRQLLGFNA